MGAHLLARVRRRARWGGAALLLAGAAAVLTAAPAAAHVVPASVVELDVHESDVTADLVLPTADLATASGIALPAATSGGDDAPTAAEAAASAAGAELTPAVQEAVADYLEDHLAVTSAAGGWDVAVADVATATTEQWGTGAFPSVTAAATLTPPAGADPDVDLRSFVLEDDAVLHQVVTADVFVVLRSDWAAGEVRSPRSIGAITVDTVTGTIPSLPVDLGSGGDWQGFTGMVRLGVAHIAEGTDHQLFLLTLLLPAPVVAATVGSRRRWTGVATPRRAVRRITAITLAFTAGHSLTLALGAIGLPVPQQPVEVLIALSILVAAVHALRPVFPGREPVVAGLFGLVHGMAFSTTLSALDLTGGQLVLSLLGFNLGIEAVQLLVVLLVLPPLVVLARTRAHRPLRVGGALLTGVAAVGWVLDRTGVTTPLGAAADGFGALAPWVVLALWLAAGGVLVRARVRAAAPRVAVGPRSPV